MTKLTKSLKADLPALAELLRSKGKGKDTILAHINPREAALLKRHGGSGEINPDTGLPMFDDGEGIDAYAGGTQEQIAAQNQANQVPNISPITSDQSAPITDFRGQSIENEADRGTVTPEQAAFSQQYYKPYSTADITAGNLQAGLTGGGQLPVGGLNYATPAGPVSPENVEQPQAKPSGFLGNVTTETLVKALGLGGLGLLGARNARQGNADVQAAKQEQQAIASPYQAQGQEMIGAAQRGELTPQSQQAYQAAMAQSNQALASRGGVGQQQQQQQMANLYNQLLQNQYTYGLQVAQIGDNIAIGAIKSGLQQDRALQQTTQNFYTQLAAIASGNVIGGTRQGVV
jgi:hypothetical protein